MLPAAATPQRHTSILSARGSAQGSKKAPPRAANGASFMQSSTTTYVGNRRALGPQTGRAKHALTRQTHPCPPPCANAFPWDKGTTRLCVLSLWGLRPTTVGGPRNMQGASLSGRRMRSRNPPGPHAWGGGGGEAYRSGLPPAFLRFGRRMEERTLALAAQRCGG